MIFFLSGSGYLLGFTNLADKDRVDRFLFKHIFKDFGIVGVSLEKWRLVVVDPQG